MEIPRYGEREIGVVEAGNLKQRNFRPFQMRFRCPWAQDRLRPPNPRKINRNRCGIFLQPTESVQGVIVARYSACRAAPVVHNFFPGRAARQE